MTLDELITQWAGLSDYPHRERIAGRLLELEACQIEEGGMPVNPASVRGFLTCLDGGRAPVASAFCGCKPGDVRLVAER